MHAAKPEGGKMCPWVEKKYSRLGFSQTVDRRAETLDLDFVPPLLRSSACRASQATLVFLAESSTFRCSSVSSSVYCTVWHFSHHFPVGTVDALMENIFFFFFLNDFAPVHTFFLCLLLSLSAHKNNKLIQKWTHKWKPYHQCHKLMHSHLPDTAEAWSVWVKTYILKNNSNNSFVNYGSFNDINGLKKSVLISHTHRQQQADMYTPAYTHTHTASWQFKQAMKQLVTQLGNQSRALCCGSQNDEFVYAVLLVHVCALCCVGIVFVVSESTESHYAVIILVV